MSESQAILIRLQRQKARTHGLLTPNLKQTTSSELFAGRKFRVAARQMRVLTPDRSGFANAGHIDRLSAEVSHRFQNPEQGLHINPKMIEGSKSWDGVERVFHGAGAIQTKRETPAMPGELRQGSIIPRMETFPKPGQSIDDFRQQTQSTPRPSHTDDAPKKVGIAPKSRLYTKVEEISRSPSKPPAASVDEPDSPSLSLRSPPTIPSQTVQMQIEKGLMSLSAFESKKQGSPQTDTTLGQPSALSIVSRKAETDLEIQPKQDAPDVSQVIPDLPQHDQVSRQVDTPTESKQANPGGEVTTSQETIKKTSEQSGESISPVQLSSQIQRSPTTNEQESFHHSETPGKLLSESKEPVSEKPILQAKPVQRQLSKLLQAKPVQPKPSKLILPISPNTNAPSESAPIHPVQRALSKDEEVVENNTFTVPELHGKDLLEEPATESAETPAPVQRSFSKIPGKLLPESEEPASEKPILQAKLIQPKPSESGKSIQVPSDPVQRISPPSDSPEKLSPIQRAEINNLPTLPVTKPSVDKPKVSASDKQLVGKMPLVEKIHSNSRAENLLRTIDVEQSPLKSIRPIMLQRQPSPLVQPAKYQSLSMSKVLPDMLMLSRSLQPDTVSPQLAASGATISVSPNQMPLARMAEQSASPLSKSVEQPVTISNRSEGVFSSAVQRTIDDNATQEQPSDSPQGNKKPVDLNALAEEIFPIVKRLLSIEADRSGSSFR